MDTARWKIIDELLDAALERPPGERERFVAQQAGRDLELRRQVLALLNASDDAGEFLDDSAMGVAAKALAKTEEFEVSMFGYLKKKIATYVVERPLGAGGMGEIYLAFDEKLKRKVALKILPAEFVSNDERVQRFELEARAISSLNHPNIVTIYDVGNFEGVNYIATEFVEGKTLRDLKGGQYKLRNIVINSMQICDALQAAHNAGIIHRDIKPENIMIRKDGYAKILDFGLAKLTEANHPTIHDMAKTSKGVIIGTPAYMSPAQISDERVDHRTDLWSAGVVLYEFLTGTHPFRGATRQETFQAILSKTPPPASSLNPELPVQMDLILKKLLEKDPAKGYQAAAELRADLKAVKREIDSSPSWDSDHSVPPNVPDRPAFGRWIGVAAAALALVAVASGTYYYLANGREAGAIDWSAAHHVPLTDQAGTEYFPSISPDGQMFVYAGEEDGDMDIIAQRIGTKTRLNLTPDSTAEDTQPAFSPDGKTIAFRSERSPRGIYLMPASGGEARHISDTGFHPSWSHDGKEIVISSFGRDQPTVRPAPGSVLAVINVATGLKRELAKIEASFPAWSPNGHRIAYWFYTGTFGRRDIATIPAAGGDPVVVAKDFAVSNWNPVWSPDGRYLYFVSSKTGNMNFWRVQIDEKSGAVLSEPEPVIIPAEYGRHLSFSADGKRLLYVKTNNTANIQGVDFDPVAGKPVGSPFWITQGDREVSRAELSADGKQFVLRLMRRNQDDIAVVSRDGREWRDVTNDEPFDRYVRWSPDGKRVAFGSDRNGGGQVWIANADGTDLRQVTFTRNDEAATGFPVWDPTSGRLAVYFDGVTKLLDPNKTELEQTVVTLPKDPLYRLVVWDWSPDGKKLAGVLAEGDKRHIGYFSLETNQYHVVVQSNDGLPSWLPDSRRFIYESQDKIYLADIQTKEAREIFSNPEVDIRSPFISRDGKLLYYVAGNNESNIWLLDLAAEK